MQKNKGTRRAEVNGRIIDGIEQAARAFPIFQISFFDGRSEVLLSPLSTRHRLPRRTYWIWSQVSASDRASRQGDIPSSCLLAAIFAFLPLGLDVVRFVRTVRIAVHVVQRRAAQYCTIHCLWAALDSETRCLDGGQDTVALPKQDIALLQHQDDVMALPAWPSRQSVSPLRRLGRPAYSRESLGVWESESLRVWESDNVPPAHVVRCMPWCGWRWRRTTTDERGKSKLPAPPPHRFGGCQRWGSRSRSLPTWVVVISIQEHGAREEWRE